MVQNISPYPCPLYLCATSGSKDPIATNKNMDIVGEHLPSGLLQVLIGSTDRIQ